MNALLIKSLLGDTSRRIIQGFTKTNKTKKIKRIEMRPPHTTTTQQNIQQNCHDDITTTTVIS